MQPIDLPCCKKMRAFSLVELSIVLVILGLLAGGVLAGQSLIHAAELRSISGQISRFTTAIGTFRDKYFALPGDMNNATQFWGFQGTAAAPNCVSNSGIAAVSATGTCDGNGNGQMEQGVGVGATAEEFQFWRQLALAGLVEGQYSGVSNPGGSATGRSALPGTNVPAGKLGNTGYSIEYYGSVTGSPILWNASYGNAFVFGGVAAGCCPPETPMLNVEDTWNIDTKLDDGKPSTGGVLTFYRHSYNDIEVGAAASCTTTDVDGASDYLLTNTAGICNLDIKSGY